MSCSNFVDIERAQTPRNILRLRQRVIDKHLLALLLHRSTLREQRAAYDIVEIGMNFTVDTSHTTITFLPRSFWNPLRPDNAPGQCFMPEFDLWDRLSSLSDQVHQELQKRLQCLRSVFSLANKCMYSATTEFLPF